MIRVQPPLSAITRAQVVAALREAEALDTSETQNTETRRLAVTAILKCFENQSLREEGKNRGRTSAAHRRRHPRR